MSATVPEDVPSDVLFPAPLVDHPVRPAGVGVAVVLLSCMTPAALAATLIAPVQPAIAAAFADTPGVAALVPAIVTVPGLIVGLLAPFAGGAIDRFGRVPLMVGALIVYALVGILPLWLDSLPLIVASRAVVGVAEGVVVTCTVALTADHFHGRRRDRMFGLQTVVSSIAAVAFLAVGGALGEASWRVPFSVYLAGLVLAALVTFVVPEPPRRAGQGSGPLPALPRRRLTANVAVTFVVGMIFVTPLVELSFRLAEIGVTSTATIGLLSAVAAVGTAASGILFGAVARVGARRLFVVGGLLACVGIVLMGLAAAPLLVAVGGVVASAGSGLLLPTALSWTSAGLSHEQHGRGIGWFTAAFAFGQFATPLIGLPMAAVLGGVSGVLVAVGALAALLAAVAPAVVARFEPPAARRTEPATA